MMKNVTHLQAGDKVPNVVLLDIQGNSLETDTLWVAAPTLLTFLRHFG